MKTIDLVQNANDLFKTLARATCPEDTCPDCIVKMKEIDRYDLYKTYPISGPELVRNVWIEYECPECGRRFTVYNNQY